MIVTLMYYDQRPLINHRNYNICKEVNFLVIENLFFLKSYLTYQSPGVGTDPYTSAGIY